MGYLFKFSFFLIISLSLFACGGGGGSTPEVNNTSNTISIESHSFNPDMISGTSSSNSVYVTYFNPNGSVDSYHKFFEWKDNQITYGNEYLYTYDAKGHLENEEMELTYLREVGLELNTFRTTSYQYDSEFNLVRVEVYDDTENRMKKVVDHSYDLNGNRINTVIDELIPSTPNTNIDYV